MSTNVDVGVESETGLLKAVIVHRPGNELRRLREDNLGYFLYDALPSVDQAQRSHDVLTKYLCDHAVHVFMPKDLLSETLNYSTEAQGALIDGIVKNTFFNVGPNQQQTLDALHQWLSHRTPQQLTDDAIAGVACSIDELGDSPTAQILLNNCQSVTEFVVPPLPNLLFTRDAFSIMEKNVFIWRMAKPARRNEPLIFRVIFEYHPYLSGPAGLRIVDWEPAQNDVETVSVEGGDVAYLGNETLLIGNSERTTRSAIEAISRTGLFQQVIAVEIPHHPDYIHIDTILSSAGKNVFTLHKTLVNRMEIFTVNTHDNNRNIIPKAEWISHGNDICQVFRTLLNNPHLTFYDAADEATSVVEQRECRHNVFAIDDCHVLTYDGGDEERGVVAALTRDGTCRVGLVPPEGLLEGGGGTHCMTNALRRESTK